MITPDKPRGVPAHAIPIYYKPPKGKGATYWIWRTDDGKYQWDCLGNCGEANNEKDAITEARNWIAAGTGLYPVSHKRR